MNNSGHLMFPQAWWGGGVGGSSCHPMHRPTYKHTSTHIFNSRDATLMISLTNPKNKQILGEKASKFGQEHPEMGKGGEGKYLRKFYKRI